MQYGIRLSRELDGMTWEEFKTLLSGIMPETPLGRIVSIRAETDKEVIKNFTDEQRHIHSAWRRKTAKHVSEEDMQQALESFKNFFIEAAGGVEALKREK